MPTVESHLVGAAAQAWAAAASGLAAGAGLDTAATGHTATKLYTAALGARHYNRAIIYGESV